MSYGLKDGSVVQRTATNQAKQRHGMPKIERLVKQGRLIPIIAKSGDDLALIGYRRKTTSRKANQRPILLPRPFVLKKPDA
jgi:hypothetical protein